MTDNTSVCPDEGAAVHVALHVYVCEPTVTAVLDPTATEVATGSQPPPKMVALTTVVPAVPVLLRVTVQVVAVEPLVHVAVPDTLAVDVNDPNRPNTNPAMAMAAMSVMAMRMTVAMTGEIAFLPFTFVICILNSNLLTRLNKNCVSTISV